MTTTFRYLIGASSGRDIRAHLVACDPHFRPPLGGRVAIEDYARKLADQAVTLEAWSGATLVGLVAAYVADDASTLYISNVSVLPEHTGKGVARTLLQQAAAHARERGLPALSLEVSKTSMEALRLYSKLGFRLAEDRGERLLMRFELKTQSEGSMDEMTG